MFVPPQDQILHILSDGATIAEVLIFLNKIVEGFLVFNGTSCIDNFHRFDVRKCVRYQSVVHFDGFDCWKPLRARELARGKHYQIYATQACGEVLDNFFVLYPLSCLVVNLLFKSIKK